MDEIKQQIKSILMLVEDKKIKREILDFFTKDVKIYSQNIVKLDWEIETNIISLYEATKRFFLFTNEILQRAEKLEKVINKRAIIKKIKDTFRRLLINVPGYRTSIVKRAYDKPRGYPGDYQLLEIIYDNKPISKGIGYCVDKYILNDDYIQAVRNRKDKMKEILGDFIKNSKLSSINILNLGCGPCREIKELFLSDFSMSKNLTFTLVDQDKEALDFSSQALKQVPKNIKFKFINENVLNLFRDKKYKDILKKQDMIYAIGLADYLPDIFLGRLIKFCFELLKPKGEFIFAHKDVKKYKTSAPDWFCDWYFFPRGKKELEEVVNAYLNNYKFNINFHAEKSKHILFIIINKI